MIKAEKERFIWSNTIFLPDNPRFLLVGIGCRRGTSQALIAHAITTVFQNYDLSQTAIASLATLDRKATETGLLDYCHRQGYPLQTFTRQELQSFSVPHPSAIVEQYLYLPSVAEAAALRAANCDRLLVPKQIFKTKEGKEAVTLAIAQANKRY